MVEPTISQAPLKQHAKRRFFSLQHRRISDEVFTDTIIIKRGKLSIRGFKYAQLYVCSRSRMTKVYLMKSKDQALNSLLQFFTDVGIPDKIVYDGAREFSSQAWCQELAKRHVAWHQTEPYHQHKNQAEPRVRDIKMLALEILSTSGASDNYWCYAIELAEDLLNFRAVESLS